MHRRLRFGVDNPAGDRNLKFRCGRFSADVAVFAVLDHADFLNDVAGVLKT